MEKVIANRNVQYIVCCEDFALQQGIVYLLERRLKRLNEKGMVSEPTWQQLKNGIERDETQNAIYSIILYLGCRTSDEMTAIIEQYNVKNTRVLIFLDVPCDIKPESIGNCDFLSTRGAVKEFEEWLQITARKDYEVNTQSFLGCRTEHILMQLSYHGYNTACISNITGFSEKKVYRIKKHILERASLGEMNTLGLYLFCRIWMVLEAYQKGWGGILTNK